MRTPCVDVQGVTLKREDLQTTGSFKWRGVQAQLLASGSRPTGIVCVSTGNTGKAVARAASEIGVPAHVFCTTRPQLDKYAYMRKYGAVIHIQGASFSQTANAAAAFAASDEMVFCSPGSSWPFACGVAGIISELWADSSDISVIYAPVGGGGLISGLGMALDEWPGARPRLVGVQAANSPFVYDLFCRRSAATVERPTVADCLAGDLEDDAIIRSLIHELVDAVVLLSDDQLLAGALALADGGIYVEPGAAAGYVAARAAITGGNESGRICAIISGGNPSRVVPRPRQGRR